MYGFHKNINNNVDGWFLETWVGASYIISIS